MTACCDLKMNKEVSVLEAVKPIFTSLLLSLENQAWGAYLIL